MLPARLLVVGDNEGSSTRFVEYSSTRAVAVSIPKAMTVMFINLYLDTLCTISEKKKLNCIQQINRAMLLVTMDLTMSLSNYSIGPIGDPWSNSNQISILHHF